MTAALVSVLFLVGAAASIAGPTPAGAQSSTTAEPTRASTPVTVPATDVTASTVAEPAPTPNIIPAPNTGREPRDPGDRGGWWQEALFFLMCGAVLLIGGLAWLESRRARRRQGRLGRPAGPA